MVRLFVLSILFSMVGIGAQADKAGECTRLWQLEKELGCPSIPPDLGSPSPSASKNDHFIVNSDFGPSKCVTRDDSEKEKKNLKKECDGWLKERKDDLGSSYLTGTCSSNCGPCPRHSALVQCSVRGEAHYRVK